MFQAREQLVEIAKFDNFDFRQEAGIMLSSPWKPAWWLDSRATIFGEWMRVKDSDYFDCPFDRNIAYAMVSANATFRFVRSHDLSLTLNGFARTKAYQGPMDLPASGNLDINLRYAFCGGNAIVNLYCNDIFRTMMITPKTIGQVRICEANTPVIPPPASPSPTASADTRQKTTRRLTRRG